MSSPRHGTISERARSTRKRLGFALRAGYPLAENLSQRWRYTLRRDDITDVPANAATVIAEQEGDSALSSIGHTIVYDTRDSRFSPREGLIASVNHEIAGIGGSVKFLKTDARGSVFVPLTDSISGNAGLGGGYVEGLGQDVRVLDRFSLGSRELRGFAPAGASPRDRATGDAVGGNWYYAGTFAVSFPLGLPNEAGIRARSFLDYGSTGLTDDTPPGILDRASLRASAGVGLSWASLIGPMNIDLGWPIQRENYDDTQLVRFSFGTRF